MSVLSVLAASMSPGDWELVPGFDPGPLLGGLAEGNRLPYCNGTNWDPTSATHRVPMIVSDHDDDNGPQYCSYNETTNTVDSIELIWLTDPQWGSHAFDMTTCNPFTGAVFRSKYASTQIGRCVTPATGGFALAYSWIGLPNITTSMTWWYGDYDDAGAQGALIVFTTVFGGILTAFDGITDEMITSLGGPFINNAGEQYHCVLEYSAVHNCCVGGGGNAYPRKLFRLDSNHSMTILTDPPLNVGVQPNINGANFCVDPVSGNFLILGDQEFWELNPLGSGTYTELPVPPAHVANRQVSGNRGDIMSFAIETYGVTGYFLRAPDGSIEFWVYKHQASVPPGPSGTIVMITKN